jgi:hypothetical protein
MTRDSLVYAECVARFRAICRVVERRDRPDWGAILAGLPQDPSASLVSAAEVLQERHERGELGYPPD